MPAPYGIDPLFKYGENLSVDVGSTPEDIWTPGGVYPFPTAAAETTIVSTSLQDAEGGTGSFLAVVEGLDSNYRRQINLATLTGTTPVVLATEYLRVYRAFVTGISGANENNVGDIQIYHGTTLLAQIDANIGQTLMAIYTVPVDYEKAILKTTTASIGKTAVSSYARLAVQYKPFSASWLTFETSYLSSQGTSALPRPYQTIQELPPGTDVRVRVIEVSANNIALSYQAEFELWRRDDRTLALIRSDDFVFPGGM